MHTTYNAHAGLTFIELLLYMSIALIMVALLGRIGVEVLESSNAASAREEVNYYSLLISEDLRNSFMRAAQVVSPLQSASSSVLVLAMHDLQLDPTIYSLDAGILWKQEGTNDPVQLTSDSVLVTEVQFLGLHATDEPGSVWTEVLLESTQDSSIYSVLQTAFSLRW